MTIKSEENPEIETEIKVLSDEIAAVRTQRKELRITYKKNDYVLLSRMAELFKKGYELDQKKKILEEDDYESY